MRRIHSKAEGIRVVITDFPLYVYADFPDPQGAFMYVLVTCKNEEDPIKNGEWSQHYPSILRRSRAANSIIDDGIWPIFKLIQAFIVVLVSCKNKEDPFKNEGTRVVTTFLPL